MTKSARLVCLALAIGLPVVLSTTWPGTATTSTFGPSSCFFASGLGVGTSFFSSFDEREDAGSAAASWMLAGTASSVKAKKHAQTAQHRRASG